MLQMIISANLKEPVGFQNTFFSSQKLQLKFKDLILVSSCPNSQKISSVFLFIYIIFIFALAKVVPNNLPDKMM